MALTATKTTSGTISADEVQLLGIKRTSRGVLQPDGHTWKSVDEVVGVARYRVDGDEKEIEFTLTLAQINAVKTAIGAAGLAAIRAAEKV